MINDLKCDQKALFKSLDTVLNRKYDINYPSCNAEELPNNFANYFDSKISTIGSELSSSHDTVHVTLEYESNLLKTNEMLDRFVPVDEANVSKLISRIARKSCHLDPIPSSILKYILHDLTTVITNIINVSTSTASMPSCLKFDLLSPRLKKPSLDHEHYSSF